MNCPHAKSVFVCPVCRLEVAADVAELGLPDPAADRYARDLTIPCPECLEATGAPCAGPPEGIVHFGRRLKRLILERRPDLLGAPS